MILSTRGRRASNPMASVASAAQLVVGGALDGPPQQQTRVEGHLDALTNGLAQGDDRDREVAGRDVGGTEDVGCDLRDRA